jgi:addiction module RelE/StbE family toxin
MTIKFSAKFEGELDRLSRSNLELVRLVKKQLNLFLNNPKHPSLRNHKLSGINNLRSVSVNKSVRMVYLLEKDAACFVDIGTHDEVYRK